MKRKVFISHSSYDKPFVLKLKKDLELNYISTWLDQDEMFPGDSLQEKLDSALDESTHFVIILSPNSVNSEWVKYELKNALNQVEKSAIEKIIPFKYRECKIPETLDKLLYLDIAKETMYFRHENLETHGSKYYKELDRLIQAINKSTPVLSEAEKDDILGKTGPIPLVNPQENTVRMYLKVVGYNNVSKYINTYIDKSKLEGMDSAEIKQFKPIVLPFRLKAFGTNLDFGTDIIIKHKSNEEKVKFASFSSNNSRIAIPKSVRTKLEINLYDVLEVVLHYDSNQIIIHSDIDIE